MQQRIRSETDERMSDAPARGELYTTRRGPCNGLRPGSMWSTRPGRKHSARGRTARGSSEAAAAASAGGPSCTARVSVDAIRIRVARSKQFPTVLYCRVVWANTAYKCRSRIAAAAWELSGPIQRLCAADSESNRTESIGASMYEQLVPKRRDDCCKNKL